MSETPTQISTENNYVVQLSHNTDNNVSVKYLIKDKALTDEVEGIKALLEGYKGLAGSDQSGELSETWLTDNVSPPLPGIYIVKSTDLTFDGDTIEMGTDDETTINVLLKAWETYLHTDDSTESYINSLYDYSYATEINLPALLIVGEDSTYTLIDSNGVVWKRIQVENHNVWINLWNNKANIQDFRKLCEIVEIQQNEIDNLSNEIEQLQKDVADLISLKELADILTGTVDAEGSFNNVLVIGNDINYYVNDTRCRVEELLKKYLHINGLVVWMQNTNTIDALKYLVPVPNTNDYPKMIRNKDDNIYFSDYPIDINQIDIAEFDVVVILLNRNDMYSNTVYGNIAMASRIGSAESANGLTISTDSSSIEYFKNEEVGISENPTENSTVVKYVPAAINKNTIYGALTAIIQVIKNANPEMTFRMATPITWEKNTTSVMTSTQNKNFTDYTSMMQNTLCKNNGIPFISTVQISGESKVNQLRDRADGLSDAANQKIIMEYISKICADVNMSSGQNVTYNINTDQTLSNSIKSSVSESNGKYTAYNRVANKTFEIPIIDNATSITINFSSWIYSNLDKDANIGKTLYVDYKLDNGTYTNGWMGGIYNNNTSKTIELNSNNKSLTLIVKTTTNWPNTSDTNISQYKDKYITYSWNFSYNFSTQQ